MNSILSFLKSSPEYFLGSLMLAALIVIIVHVPHRSRRPPTVSGLLGGGWTQRGIQVSDFLTFGKTT